jgi:hypothetical protein
MASQFTDEHELRATVGRFRSRAGQVFVRELTSEERKSIELDNEDKIRAKRLAATSDFGRGFAVGVGVSFIVASAIYLYFNSWTGFVFGLILGSLGMVVCMAVKKWWNKHCPAWLRRKKKK